MTEHEQDHERLADEADAQADDLGQRTADLAEHIEDTRRDVERKAADHAVPGIGGDPDPGKD